MLSRIIQAKKLFWDIYNISDEITSQIEYIDKIIANKNITQKEYKEFVENIIF